MRNSTTHIESLRSTKMGQMLKSQIQRRLFRMGYEIRKLSEHESATISTVLERTKVGTLIDVGANQGQYALRMRALGFEGTILSFEPYSRAFTILSRCVESDPNWIVVQRAIGAKTGRSTLHISANSVSSSLREQTELHLQADIQADNVGTELVDVSRLDDEVPSAKVRGPYWLKIDTQGYEAEVLAGASMTLDATAVLEIELSTQEVYRGQALYLQLLSVTQDLGFMPVIVRPGLRDPINSTLLQFELILVNPSHFGPSA